MDDQDQRQEMFNKVATHLLTQNCQSQRPSTLGKHQDIVCAYRGEEGRKCAIGVLIPDEVYDPAMEALSVLMLTERFPSLGFMKGHIHFLDRLQRIHDQYEVGQWPDLLTEAGQERGLDVKCVTEFGG